VKKSPKFYPGPFFVKINSSLFTVEKNSMKILAWYFSNFYKKIAQNCKNNRPMGENAANPVTLDAGGGKKFLLSRHKKNQKRRCLISEC
jgi:hypothetical protein